MITSPDLVPVLTVSAEDLALGPYDVEAVATTGSDGYAEANAELMTSVEGYFFAQKLTLKPPHLPQPLVGFTGILNPDIPSPTANDDGIPVVHFFYYDPDADPAYGHLFGFLFVDVKDTNVLNNLLGIVATFLPPT